MSEQINQINDRKKSKVEDNHTNTASVVFQITTIMLSNENDAYLTGLCHQLKRLDEIKQQNSMEKIIGYLKGKFLFLYHDGKNNLLVNVC